MAGKARWVDLAQEFYEGMPRGHVLPPPTVRTLKQVGRDPFNIMEYTTCTHIGTHLDAPMHFQPGGQTIEQLPLERLVGEAAVVSMKKGRVEPITIKDLEGATPQVRDGDMVLFHTGWGAKWGTDEYHEHPYLADELVDWLVARKVPLIGVDFVTPDLPFQLRKPGFTYPIHRGLLPRGILIIENLNLEAVAGQRVILHAFPVKIRGGDGAPVRVVARVDA
ncbi:MAG: cyclase family protein [Deltaproteobacteria bacterium]|nr:cyclase family protein [Deltaproteobacteria bacterium]